MYRVSELPEVCGGVEVGNTSCKEKNVGIYGLRSGILQFGIYLFDHSFVRFFGIEDLQVSMMLAFWSFILARGFPMDIRYVEPRVCCYLFSTIVRNAWSQLFHHLK